jgi:phenylalanyl-tRNA synthetase alpha chain
LKEFAVSQLDELKRQIESLGGESRQALVATQTVQDCEAVRVAFLGRNGKLTTLFKMMPALTEQERPEAGKLINELKGRIEADLEAKREQLSAHEIESALRADAVDVTLPGRPMPQGHLHITTQTLREIYAVFGQMGFQVFETQEVESDEYNFQLLNIPEDHPARDMWSTIYTTKPGVLLRTHTSPGQIRVMREFAPEPIRALLPGKCYRYEQVDATHEWQLHQVEGLAIGKHIRMSDLKGVLAEFVRQLFGRERKVIFRCAYFPFTEPSMEAGMDCFNCRGLGCGVCKGSGWIEFLGSGMVHPTVLQNGGYDPREYSGFAFGMGVERVMMLRHRIDDIRHFYANDLRFLSQF